MNLEEHVALSKLTTMQLGGTARYVSEFRSVDELLEIMRFATDRGLPIFVLGGGSNTLATDEGYEGVVALNRIAGYEESVETDGSHIIKVGAGENWDATVRKSVESGLTGIEALSAIPGTVGAAPVQNIGAYGQEVATTIVSVEALDMQTGSVVNLDNEACGFSYRHSIFRGSASGRYIILTVSFRLQPGNPTPPFYAPVESYLAKHEIDPPTPEDIRNTVMAIRFEKLPDPTTTPNTGSFFKNAIIDESAFTKFHESYPDAPHYPADDGLYKIPTGWLIEQCGFKGTVHNGIRIHTKNALVLINESATSYRDLEKTRDMIIQTVYDKFGISIQQEPLLLTSRELMSSV